MLKKCFYLAYFDVLRSDKVLVENFHDSVLQ